MGVHEFSSRLTTFLSCRRPGAHRWPLGYNSNFLLDITNEDNIFDLFMIINNTIQFGEDADVKIDNHEPPDNDDV